MRPVDSVMLEQRATSFTRRSIKTASKVAGLRLALSMLDLTTLEGKDSPESVRSLCSKAIQPWHDSHFEIDPPLPSAAAVCVYPKLVPIARAALAGSTVKVASVATAFPSGQFPLDVRLADVEKAIEAGAEEIDMVINRGAFLAGEYATVADEIARTREAAHSATLKIILETGELETYDNVRRACDLAIRASCPPHEQMGEPMRDGAVFLKTSTGKVSPAATLASTLVLLEAVRDHFRATGVRLGVKPAGGIREAKTALHYLVMVKETVGEAWLTPELFRFGASALANDLVRQIVKERTGHYMAGYDFSVT